MIVFNHVSKTFHVPVRKQGMLSALRSFFQREYKEIKAIHDVSFEIPKGQIVGYLGANGAGKSTTIKVMCGILKKDSGTCLINGFDPFVQRKEYVSCIGVVFGQRSQLWWDLPVVDSFQLLKDIYNIPKVVFDTRLEELSTMLDIKDIMYMPTRQLSLGQKMRCEIIASLLHNPSVLFLDEPTIGLDTESKVALRSLIKKINKKYDTTIVLTTHDMQDIESLADRLLIIDHGSIVFDGCNEDFRNKYSVGKVIKIQGINNIQPSDLYQIVSCKDGITTLHSRSDINTVLDVLQSHVSIQDIQIEDEPIENILLHAFHGGSHE